MNENNVFTTGYFVIASSAITGLVAYFATSRSIRASERQSSIQIAHDTRQREEDRLNQLRAIQMVAHDAALRRAYIVIITFLRYSEDRLFAMRHDVTTGTVESEVPVPPEDPESTYAEIDLVISDRARIAYQSMRKSLEILQNSFNTFVEIRQASTVDSHLASLRDARKIFESAASHFSEASNVLKEQMRADVNPATLTYLPMY